MVNVTAASVAATAQPLIDWVAAHPGQAALYTVNGVVLLAPAAATAPIFAAFGLTALGPAGGSLAASTMSYFGYVPAGGVYALAQSAAMGGYGAGLAAGAAQAGAVVSSGLTWFMGRNNTAA